FGVGGYASGPVVLAARFMNVPTAIAEQNAAPGLTNRILGRFALRIFVSFPETLSFFDGKKAVLAGNPVRRGFVDAPAEKRDRDGRFTVLVYGGSQGAKAINDAVLAALPLFRDRGEDIVLIHQTGAADYERVRAAYERAGAAGEVHSFIDDMAAFYDRADLLVCRAGATTVAEITARGKAAVFIPFPFAVGDHQTKNAEVLVRQGAAEMILQKDLDGEGIFRAVRRLAGDREGTARMGERARKLGNIHAARDIVAECLRLLDARGDGTERNTD
ncbi:MAG TPA: UDP-N-acetylglucosamine--N-acetylmuramyl-(pentapeptide) pyrophosphoryl-undecaprenol N-acetylglucosamine transferase, partial [Syntrophales bacterium]|nr:UDP-N-acetylglucosamine--N-acetylmuramyl-(pentapeptide) pyrophosphoryl-undecaprenol N-acetylglucosamine transferase [Syntrophales bacterium]